MSFRWTPFFAAHALSDSATAVDLQRRIPAKRRNGSPPGLFLKIWTSWNWKVAFIMIMWLYVDWKSQCQNHDVSLICHSFTCIYIIEKDFKTCRNSHEHTVFPLLVETCSSSMPPLCTITLYGFHQVSCNHGPVLKTLLTRPKSQIIC